MGRDAFENPLTREMYRVLCKIDPGECEELTLRPLSDFYVNLRGERKDLVKFLSEGTRIIAVDHFSTKEQNDEAIKIAGMSVNDLKMAEQFYLAFIRNWGVISYLGKNIGLAQLVIAHNGFASYVTNEELVSSDNPQEKYKEAITRFLADVNNMPNMKVQEYTSTQVMLHRDFLKECRIVKKGLLYHVLNRFRPQKETTITKPESPVEKSRIPQIVKGDLENMN